ncbi:type III-A CRISPR-associated RAMP protein Csm5 [Fervidobacterium sp. 2310opik-2]|uniref:type III-A CRISPR-associated RAMP protein Csm5 n=1 Tax=Fervidobacterium sp. 2310opik-2 TaxID=1755815 RepID=UPI0013DF457B|nr:type III-A CRISPR-associated RAMP protein Csm5 [Fervidobacterium sp. 2310opik-2]KAF2961053.1 hypothetical protein AS161_03500 [Fervidobacterium sp. 2310opik-2]
MSSEFEKWRKVKLKLLTPLRVGSGEKYPFFTLANAGNRYYRLSLKGFYNNSSNALDYNLIRLNRELKDDEYLYEVSLKFNLDKSKSGFNEVHEMLHHPSGGVYIPGSSIKGVLRLAFSQLIYSKDKKKFEENLNNDIKYGKKSFKSTNDYINNEFRAQSKEIHNDLFRFVIVSDTNIVNTKTEIWRAEIINFTNGNIVRKRGRSFLVETIPQGTEFEFYIKIDHERLENLKKYERLNYDKKLLDNLTLDGIFNLLNEYYSTALKDELSMFEGYRSSSLRNVNLNELIMFYRNLENNKHKIRIGDGGGLMFTSLFPMLSQENRIKIRNIIKYVGNMRAPLSRNYIVKGSEDFFTPVQMGWCEVRFD